MIFYSHWNKIARAQIYKIIFLSKISD